MHLVRGHHGVDHVVDERVRGVEVLCALGDRPVVDPDLRRRLGNDPREALGCVQDRLARVAVPRLGQHVGAVDETTGGARVRVEVADVRGQVLDEPLVGGVQLGSRFGVFQSTPSFHSAIPMTSSGSSSSETLPETAGKAAASAKSAHVVSFLSDDRLVVDEAGGAEVLRNGVTVVADPTGSSSSVGSSFEKFGILDLLSGNSRPLATISGM